MATSQYGYALNYDWKHPWPRAPVPANEDDRLNELLRYSILDSEQDEKFDKLCRIACKEMKCPIAAVSFIDKQRQWFKANSGLTQKQIPRDVALCAHTIMHPKRALIVEDASQDERFMNNPLVTRASAVRFYAGVPITTPNGFCIGSVFVLDVKSHQDVNAMILHKIAAKVLKYMDERTKGTSNASKPKATTPSSAPAVEATEQTPGETALREQEAESAPVKPVVKAPPSPAAAAAPAPELAPVPVSSPVVASTPAPDQVEAGALVEASNTGAIEAAQPANLGNMGSMLMNLLARTTETQQQLAAQQGVMFDTLGAHGTQLETLNDSMNKLERRFEEVRLKRQARANAANK